MEAIEIYSIIGSTASIISLFIAVIVLRKVNQIVINRTESTESSSEILVHGSKNRTAGRDIK